MKKHLFSMAINRAGIFLISGLFFLLLGTSGLRAEVSFPQTLNADFNKGVLNNVIVNNDNVYLQFSASDVGSWLTTTVLPQTLSGHKTASWNDRFVYMVGGWNDLTYVNTVYVATIQTTGISGWTTLNPLPVALRDPAVVIGTNTIYVMGGRNGSQVFNTIYYAAINSDGSIGAWQTSAVTLPVNLWGHTATYSRGYIYVIGGSSSMVETTALNTVYVTKVNALNTLSAFTTGTNLSVARNRHSVVTYNSKLYVLGGYDNSGNKTNTVFIATPGLNGLTGAWSTGTALPFPISNHSSVVTNGVISVMAGAVGATLSDKVFYANADAASLTWLTSANVMYDYTKDGSAFTGNGQVYYTGGTNLSGTPIVNCRFANMVLTANYIFHGVFVSNPFYELGAERLIDSLAFTKVYTSPANLEVTYRTAGSDGIWGDWTALVTVSPIKPGAIKQYIQYALIMTGTNTNNCTFNDMTLKTPGTQLTGNLDGRATFTKAESPYWATADISFSTGIHTFQAGATILFLPETGLTVGAAHVECNGTAVDSVKFLSFNSETGKWDGIYFNENSDAGVNSSFTYTVIANAGFGTNNANLYCYSTNEPLLVRCNIRNADGNGIRLNSAHLNIQNSIIRGNTENGLYLNNSNPTLVTSSISYNGGAGVYLTSPVSVPNFSSPPVNPTVINNNQSGLRYPSPNFSFSLPAGLPTISNNLYNGIAIDGGDVSTNQRWNAIPYDYIVLGTVRVGAYNWSPRLTIEPGNTIKFIAGTQLQIGSAPYNGGELYSIGTSDSAITFTSHNGIAGGWNGIYFVDASDYYGGVSQLDYCIIENGNDYNYLSENTAQPTLINHTIIRNAVLDGARYSGGTGSITNCQFLTNGRYPLYMMNFAANPVHTGNTYTGNIINRIALSGGAFNNNRTLNNDNVPYYVLENLIVGAYNWSPRLTLDPGIFLDFATGKKLQVGEAPYNGGELYAVGGVASPIVFRAYSGIAGDWEGIYFQAANDYYGGASTMEYCRVRFGNAQNILIEGSSQPTIKNCTIRDSGGHGIVIYQSNPSITNTFFTLNAGYPIKFTDWTCNSYLKNNSYISNTLNYIAISGGTYTDNRTVYFDNVPYHVLSNINMSAYNWGPRLTIQPGVTMAFNPGTKIQLGAAPYNGGSIWAEGKVDSTITLVPYNDSIGGWNGINFADASDYYGTPSLLKYCVVGKSASYNVLCDNANQPTFDHCTLTKSTGDGLKLTGSSTLTIKNSNFTYNAANGIYLDGTGNATIGNADSLTCNFYNNGAYDLYNNSTANVNARYNYWATGDSTLVSLKIFDKTENSAKGKVNFGPFAQVPSLMTANTVMTGTIKYVNTAASPIKNAAMAIKTFGAASIATTTSNASGVYAFPSFVSGNYKMTIVPAAAWGGVNSTDALAILNHFAMITPLTGMKLAAAD
ncbi:MAG: right-handed parallel beta-helix repeat-containing protein, partial [Bacteroidota bacterium]